MPSSQGSGGGPKKGSNDKSSPWHEHPVFAEQKDSWRETAAFFSGSCQILFAIVVFFATGKFTRVVAAIFNPDPVDDAIVLIIQVTTSLGWILATMVSTWVGVCLAWVRGSRKIRDERRKDRDD